MFITQINDILEFGQFNPYDIGLRCPTPHVNDNVLIRYGPFEEMASNSAKIVSINITDDGWADEYIVKLYSSGKIVQVGPMEIWGHIKKTTLDNKEATMSEIKKRRTEREEKDMYLITNKLISMVTSKEVIWC